MGATRSPGAKSLTSDPTDNFSSAVRSRNTTCYHWHRVFPVHHCNVPIVERNSMDADQNLVRMKWWWQLLFRHLKTWTILAASKRFVGLRSWHGALRLCQSCSPARGILRLFIYYRQKPWFVKCPTCLQMLLW
jgi:hypothetical protein